MKLYLTDTGHWVGSSQFSHCGKGVEEVPLDPQNSYAEDHGNAKGGCNEEGN